MAVHALQDMHMVAQRLLKMFSIFLHELQYSKKYRSCPLFLKTCVQYMKYEVLFSDCSTAYNVLDTCFDKVLTKFQTNSKQIPSPICIVVDSFTELLHIFSSVSTIDYLASLLLLLLAVKMVPISVVRLDK